MTYNQEPPEGSQAFYDQALAEIEQAGEEDDAAALAAIDAANAYVAPDDFDALIAASEKWIGDAESGRSARSVTDSGQREATAWRVAIKAKRLRSEQEAVTRRGLEPRLLTAGELEARYGR